MRVLDEGFAHQKNDDKPFAYIYILKKNNAAYQS